MALSKITTASLSDNAVTTAKITDANITTAKVADDAITTAKVNPAQTDITSVGTLTSATISGDVNVDSKVFNIDSSNDRIGINTNSIAENDSAKMTINADNTGAIIINNTGQTNGEFAPILFTAHATSSAYPKQGIGVKRTGDFGVGDLVFAVDSNADASDVSMTNDAKMTISQAGYITMPNQPVLSLFGDTVRVQASGQNVDTDVSFSERIDNTNSYDTANKYFDVPFSGKYLVNFYASVKSNTSYIMIKIKVGSTTEAISYGEEPNDGLDWVARSCQTILDLSAGDAVRFQLTTGSATSGAGQILESKYRGVHMFLLA